MDSLVCSSWAHNFWICMTVSGAVISLFRRYVMDELGSALRHSDEPNFKVAPFLFMPSGKLESAVR